MEASKNSTTNMGERRRSSAAYSASSSISASAGADTKTGHQNKSRSPEQGYGEIQVRSRKASVLSFASARSGQTSGLASKEVVNYAGVLPDCDHRIARLRLPANHDVTPFTKSDIKHVTPHPSNTISVGYLRVFAWYRVPGDLDGDLDAEVMIKRTRQADLERIFGKGTRRLNMQMGWSMKLVIAEPNCPLQIVGACIVGAEASSEWKIQGHTLGACNSVEWIIQQTRQEGMWLPDDLDEGVTCDDVRFIRECLQCFEGKMGSIEDRKLE